MYFANHRHQRAPKTHKTIRIPLHKREVLNRIPRHFLNPCIGTGRLGEYIQIITRAKSAPRTRQNDDTSELISIRPDNRGFKRGWERFINGIQCIRAIQRNVSNASALLVNDRGGRFHLDQSVSRTNVPQINFIGGVATPTRPSQAHESKRRVPAKAEPA